MNLQMCIHQVSANFFIRVSPKQVPFPYDEFLKLYNWKDFDSVPCGLINCGNRYDGIILATVTTCSVYT
jgi:ubiquitin carboxyl-terminal hydrolase 36/42